MIKYTFYHRDIGGKQRRWSHSIVFCSNISLLEMQVLPDVIGFLGVGKSCILMQFLENKFKIDSETTVGV